MRKADLVCLFPIEKFVYPYCYAFLQIGVGLLLLLAADWRRTGAQVVAYVASSGMSFGHHFALCSSRTQNSSVKLFFSVHLDGEPIGLPQKVGFYGCMYGGILGNNHLSE